MKSFWCLLLILLSASMLIAEQDTAYLSAYLESYPHTVLKGASAPLKWQAKDWILASGVVAAGCALYFADEEIRDMSQRNRSPFTDDLMTGFKQFGEGKYIIPAMGLTILGGYLADHPKTIDTGMLCLKSFIIANSATQVLKFATQRQRPISNNGNNFWNGEGFTRRRDSFPSGHTTIVWSLAPVIADQYKDSPLVPPLVYTIAGLTSYSRINDDKHWATDVFAGAVIGYLSAKLTLSGTPRLQFYPDPQLKGLAFQYGF